LLSYFGLYLNRFHPPEHTHTHIIIDKKKYNILFVGSLHFSSQKSLLIMIIQQFWRVATTPYKNIIVGGVGGSRVVLINLL
jgi:predicted metal-dependent RNase